MSKLLISTEAHRADLATYMSKSIPLCPTLGIHFVEIIICNTGPECLDRVFEGLTIEGRDLRDVQWQTAEFLELPRSFNVMIPTLTIPSRPS